MIYQIKLPQFEGPFDLLLYFIERDEIDIYDIPIAKLADEFLTYLQAMQTLNIDLAGDFLLMAATLMRIKAKMLLPRKEKDETGNEIDPRAELVEKIIEYKTFKEVTIVLQDMEQQRAQRTTRGATQQELDYIAQKYNTELEMEAISLYKLMNVFAKIIERFDQRQQTPPQVLIQQIPFNIANERQTILEKLEKIDKNAQQHLNFEQIFADCQNRQQAIVRFLAILELVQEQLAALSGGEQMNTFWLEKKAAWAKK